MVTEKVCSEIVEERVTDKQKLLELVVVVIEKRFVSQAVSSPPREPEALEKTKEEVIFWGRKVAALKRLQSPSFVS